MCIRNSQRFAMPVRDGIEACCVGGKALAIIYNRKERVMSATVLLLQNEGQPSGLTGFEEELSANLIPVNSIDQLFCLLDTVSDVLAVIVRIPFGDTSAENVLTRLHSRIPHVPKILWAKDGRPHEAIHLAQFGAFQYVTDDVAREELPRSLRRAAAAVASQASPETFSSIEPWRSLLIGESWPMRMVHELIRLISPRRCTVLVTGETGTGKEMIARAIHQASPRAANALVAVNCSALPADLLEAELFGHVKGAFTGAFASRLGRFELAHRGTIFLDEISEMPMQLQSKLLRVLQELEFQRLGSSETIKVDVRVIAASNTNLLERVREGKFREDLYYRLNVAPVCAPPLRKRTEDLPLLVNHFIAKICRSEMIAPKSIAPAVLSRMAEYSWPGNVRQLENMVAMAVAMSGNRELLQLSDFPGLFGYMTETSVFVVPEERISYNEAVDTFERNLLEMALRRANGNKKLAASLLKLKRTTFAAKLRALDISLPCEQEDEAEEETFTAA